MEGTFNKFDIFNTFKKKFRAEVNFANYFIPIFYWLNFYWIGTKHLCICFWILSKYCCDPLVLWSCCSLKGWKNWSNTSGRLLINLSKRNKQLFNMILFFNLFILSFWYRGSDGSIDCLKFIILKALFWAICIISNGLLWLWPQIWHDWLKEWLAYKKLVTLAKWCTLECTIAWFKSLI